MCYNRSRSLSQFFPFCLPFPFTPMFPRCVCTSVFVNVWVFIPLDFLGCVFISLDKVHNNVRMTRSLYTIFELVDRAKALSTVHGNTRTPLENSDEYIMRVVQNVSFIKTISILKLFVISSYEEPSNEPMDLSHLFIYDRILIVYVRNVINKVIKITESNQLDFWEVQVFCAICIHTFST